MAEVKTVITLPRSLPRKAKAATPGSNQDSGSTIPRPNTSLEFETVRQFRAQGRKIEAIRKMARVDGNVSSAVFSLVQNAMSGLSLRAYTAGTHELDIEGTQLVRSIEASMSSLYDYSLRYSDKNTIESFLETALREVVLTGAVAAELVLSKDLYPEKIIAVPYEDLKFKKESQGLYPVQTAAGGEIDLNIPTFWVAASHLEANSAYSYSMLEGSLDSAVYFREAIEDMRRAVRRTGHARIVVKLDAEKVRASAPAEIQSDPALLREFMDGTRDDIVAVINGLEPEDAVVTYDMAEFESLSSEGEKADYAPLISMLAGMLSTSLKTPPSILGLRLTGSQSLSNSESLVYLSVVTALQRPVEQVMSRAMTLAARLYGADVYVRAEFNSIDLRPKSELIPYEVMAQDRILEQLSLGFLTDEAAAERLGTGPRAPGAPPLSGTFFKDTKGPDVTTDQADNANMNEGAMQKALTPNTPKKGGGASQ